MSCTEHEFGEKEQATDLLMSEKFLAATYQSYLLEAATPEVRRALDGILQDVNNGQQRLFDEMNSRGWYPVTRAEDTKLAGAKQKFASKVTQ